MSQDNQTLRARATDLVRVHGAGAVDATLARFNESHAAGIEGASLQFLQLLEALWKLEDETAPPVAA